MPISGSSRTYAVAATVLVVLAVVAGLLWAATRTPEAGPPTAGPPVAIAPKAAPIDTLQAVQSLAVLRNWDRARAAAWADADAAALGRLYVAGSDAGAADVAMLRRWSARGLHVEGMSMQVLAIEIRSRTEDGLALLVTDRLVGAVAVGPAGEQALPEDRPTTRLLKFERHGSAWLVASAQEAEASPAASTAATSGSAKE